MGRCFADDEVRGGNVDELMVQDCAAHIEQHVRLHAAAADVVTVDVPLFLVGRCRLRAPGLTAVDPTLAFNA